MVKIRKVSIRRWQVIADFVRRHGWTDGVELGVLKGENLFRLLDACPGLNMVGVDVWEYGARDCRQDGARSYRRHPLHVYEVEVKRRAAGYGARCQILKLTTVEAAKAFPDETFDFVFIDADHTAEGVSADILAWGPKLKPTGWLMGHDFHPRLFPGVYDSVREILPRYVVLHDYVWAVAKADTVFA